MIRTLSARAPSTRCSSNERQRSSSPSHSRRFTLHALAARLSDSKRTILEHIPHHQQHLSSFRKRARSFLTSALVDNPIGFHSSASTERSSFHGIISVDEIYRRSTHTAHPYDAHHFDGISAPKLLQTSTLINEEQSKQILLELPTRIQALNWSLVFSTDANGFSLNQLYRRSIEAEHDSPSLLIVKDVEQNVFGAFSSHQLRISEGFIGTGESFLFTIHPEFQVYNWSGDNDFFIKGDIHSIGFGSGDGTYGLWLDGDLYHGRTCSTKTFNNEPLTTNEDFIIASVELWTFVD